MPYVFKWGSNVKHHCSVCKKLVYQRDHNGPVQVFGPDSPSAADLKAGYVPVQSMGDSKTVPIESAPAPPYVQEVDGGEKKAVGSVSPPAGN